MIKLKTGVKLANLQPQIALAIQVAYSVYQDNGFNDLRITSLNDSGHSHTSLHYSGNAVDLGVIGFVDAQRAKLAQEINGALGTDFDVLDEGNHIHIEYQPRR